MRTSNIISNAHNEYPIHADIGMTYAFYSEIMDWIAALFEYHLRTHSKTYFIRFDVKFPLDLGYTPNSCEFGKFIRNLNASLSGNDLRLDPKYLWIREQATGKHHHYHVFLLLNGNRIQSIYKVMNIATELWNKALGLPRDRRGLISYCLTDRHGNSHDNGIMLRRGEMGFDEKLTDCYTWAAYLAKSVYKGNVAPHVREFGHSQVPRLFTSED